MTAKLKRMMLQTEVSSSLQIIEYKKQVAESVVALLGSINECMGTSKKQQEMFACATSFQQIIRRTAVAFR